MINCCDVKKEIDQVIDKFKEKWLSKILPPITPISCMDGIVGGGDKSAINGAVCKTLDIY